MPQPSQAANPAPGFIQHPEHEVRTRAFAGTVTVHADNVQVAISLKAIIVDETNHAPVYYVPVEDVDQTLLRPSSRVTRCPFKGKATHWNIAIGEHEIDNAVWAYEMPYDELLELGGMMAFYANKVTISATPA